ncbi:MAG: helix-turn-helix domain-containing protein [Nakamurella sp.]
MMTTLAEVLRTYAPEISETEFAADLRSKFEHVHGTDDPGLTTGELAFLNEHGGAAAGEVIARWNPDAERSCRSRIVAESVRHVYAQTLSAVQVAELTGKSRSQITRDLNTGKLYGLSVGRHWRIPRWQFVDDAVLPGLAAVVPAIPEHLHPSVVEGFMTTPQDELNSRTPIDYLRTGGSPAPVAEMVAELARQ